MKTAVERKEKKVKELLLTLCPSDCEEALLKRTAAWSESTFDRCISAAESVLEKEEHPAPPDA